MMEEEKDARRKRKKQLYNTIREQMEFYFSDSNLLKDKFLSNLLNEVTDGFIDLDIFMKFNKIRSLTTNISDIAKALSKSSILELNSDKNKVRRITPVQKRDNIDECTIYVENFPPNADHAWLKNYFKSFGEVTYVSLPKFKTLGQNKGFAFVEFSTVDAAKRACKHFGLSDAVDCAFKEMTQGPPAKKLKLQDDSEVVNDSSAKKKEEEEQKDSSREENVQKDNNDSKQGKKKKKRKKKKKSKVEQHENIDLYVVSKPQWKRMKNKYLSLQKSNMAQLKQSLGLMKPDKNPLKKEEPTVENLEFVPGLIVKIISDKILSNIREFKAKVQNEADVAYIDVENDQRTVYIRSCTEKDSSLLLRSQLINEHGTPTQLEGEEEKCYWKKLQADRLAKHQIKSRPKVRGRQKILFRAEKLLNGPKHIHFDD